MDAEDRVDVTRPDEVVAVEAAFQLNAGKEAATSGGCGRALAGSVKVRLVAPVVD